MKLPEARSLVPLKVTPMNGAYHLAWPGGQHSASMSHGELGGLLRRLRAKDAGTEPASQRNVTYGSMVQGFIDGSIPTCWVWNTDLLDVPGHVQKILSGRQLLDSMKAESSASETDSVMTELDQAMVMVPPQNESTESEEIFIRLATPKEISSPTEKKKAFQSFPEKEGYETAFIPYGSKGKGFYYIKFTSKNEDSGLNLNSQPYIEDQMVDGVFTENAVFSDGELNLVAKSSHASLDSVKNHLAQALEIAAEDFNKSPNNFSDKERNYTLEVLEGLLENHKELRVKTPSLQEFLESPLPAKKFIEDVTSTGMPGIRSLPEHPVDIAAPGPANPNKKADEAIATAEAKKTVEDEAGPKVVPETGSGIDYQPVETPAPAENIEIVPVEELDLSKNKTEVTL